MAFCEIRKTRDRVADKLNCSRNGCTAAIIVSEFTQETCPMNRFSLVVLLGILGCKPWKHGRRHADKAVDKNSTR